MAMLNKYIILRQTSGTNHSPVQVSTLAGLLDELKGNDDPQQNYQESHQQETERGDQGGFQGYSELTRLQKSMLRAVLDENATWDLDPARCKDAEWEFHEAIEWCRASDDDIRFGHGEHQ